MSFEFPLRAENLRMHNKNLVLSLIHQYQSAGISQSVIVEKTGLKAPTIFRIFNELQADGLIESMDTVTEKGLILKKGRKPVNFCVKRNARYSVAIEFWTEYLAVAVFDFWGECIQNITYDLQPDITADDIVDIAVSNVRLAITELDIPIKKIMGIGIAAPGQVDLRNNTITHYPRIKGMHNYPIVDRFQKQLHIPVVLHNNCSALALGEFRYGKFNTGNSLFTFLIRTGVNGSFIYDNQIFVNSRNTTMEIGHIPIVMDGPECICGKNGCLEACLRTLDKRSGVSTLFSGSDADLPQFSHALHKAADYLHVAVNMISQIFSPSAYLIVSATENVSSIIAEHLSSRIEKDYFMPRIPSIFYAEYKPLITQKGIRDQVISHYFKKF